MRISDWSSDVCSSDLGGGSQRWLNLGIINLQPSELTKVTIVIALARFYAQLPPGNTRTFTALWPALVMIGLPAGLVLLQPDLRTKTGRASRRGRVCQTLWISVVAGLDKQKNQQ